MPVNAPIRVPCALMCKVPHVPNTALLEQKLRERPCCPRRCVGLKYQEAEGKARTLHLPLSESPHFELLSLVTGRDRTVLEALVYPLQLILDFLGDLVSKVVKICQPRIAPKDATRKFVILGQFD